MTNQKKRTGRPLSKAVTGKRYSLGLKVTGNIKQRLDHAAKESGRTQSAEAELRLERSFDREDSLVEVLTLAYGAEVAGILMMIGSTIDDVGPHTGFAATRTLEGANGWTCQPYAFDQAVQGVNRLLEAMRPAGDPSVPQPIPDELKEIYQQLGIAFANGSLNALLGRAATAKEKANADKIRPLLGPIAKRISASQKNMRISPGITPIAISAGKKEVKT